MDRPCSVLALINTKIFDFSYLPPAQRIPSRIANFSSRIALLAGSALCSVCGDGLHLGLVTCPEKFIARPSLIAPRIKLNERVEAIVSLNDALSAASSPPAHKWLLYIRRGKKKKYIGDENPRFAF